MSDNEKTNPDRNLLIYVAGPSAEAERPRAAAFMAAARAIPRVAVTHDWVAVMERHGKPDHHLDEATLAKEASADVMAVQLCDLFFVLTRPGYPQTRSHEPATSGGPK